MRVRNRYVALAMGLLFLTVNPQPARTSPDLAWDESALFIPPTPPPSEAAFIALLSREGLTDEELTGTLLAMGQLSDSRQVVSALIEYMEYYPCPAGLRLGSGESFPHPTRDYPAVVSLIRIGPFAAPRLVDEYVFFFENTSLAARNGRYCRLSGDITGKPHEVQSPAPRLSHIVVILTQTRPTAREAIDYALERMTREPKNDHVQRACRELIGRIVRQFPESEWAKLFPPEALKK